MQRIAVFHQLFFYSTKPLSIVLTYLIKNITRAVTNGSTSRDLHKGAKDRKIEKINAQCKEVRFYSLFGRIFGGVIRNWKGGLVAAFNSIVSSLSASPKSSLCPQKAGIQYRPNQRGNYWLTLNRYSLEIAERSDSGNNKHRTKHESLSLSAFISELMQLELTKSRRQGSFVGDDV